MGRGVGKRGEIRTKTVEPESRCTSFVVITVVRLEGEGKGEIGCSGVGRVFETCSFCSCSLVLEEGSFSLLFYCITIVQ